MTEDCKTKYPVVLIHGAGFRDLKWPLPSGASPTWTPSTSGAAPLSRKPGAGVRDIVEVYEDILRDLTARGF